MEYGEVEPIHAYGLFSVSERLMVNQVLVFEYIDVERYYQAVAEDIDRLDRELKALARKMQEFLNEEEVIINGKRVKPKVRGVSLGFRGEPEEPYLIFFIYFKGIPRKGVNYYENIYEGTDAEYPYEAYWIFPPSFEVISVEASGTVEIIGNNIVILRVEEGERLTGYEKITFKV